MTTVHACGKMNLLSAFKHEGLKKEHACFFKLCSFFLIRTPHYYYRNFINSEL